MQLLKVRLRMSVGPWSGFLDACNFQAIVVLTTPDDLACKTWFLQNLLQWCWCISGYKSFLGHFGCFALFPAEFHRLQVLLMKFDALSNNILIFEKRMFFDRFSIRP